MSLHIERARTKGRVTWLTIIGVVLLPVLIGGILVAALWNPTERLDGIRAAIVNEDEPVEIDGQLAPLGRQLTAGLVEGSDEADSNIDWVISNADDAKSGLADGTYQAAITIPENFSAAATSTAGDDPERAQIQVTTAPDARVFDAVITNQIAQIATTTMGRQLSEVYLENVLLGFTTLNDKLGTAASGAHELADGATKAATGAGELATGANALADGMGQLGTGADGLASGAGELASGVGELAGGANSLAGGAGGVADGAWQLSGGLGDLSSGLTQAVDGLGTMSSQIRAGADQAAATPIFPDEFLAAVDGAAAQTAALGEPVGTAAATAGAAATEAGAAAATAGTLTQDLYTMQAECVAMGMDPAFCERLGTAAGSAQSVAEQAGSAAQTAGAAAETAGSAVDSIITAATSAGTVAGYVYGAEGQPGLKDAIPAAFAEQLRGIADGVDQVRTGMAPLTSGLSTVATSSRDLAMGASQLAGGADALASGVGTLSGGAGQLADGASQLADGVAQSGDGATQLADGTTEFADGSTQLADGTGDLADGLTEAVDQIPTYTDGEATTIAKVVADPVTTGESAMGENLFGGSAVPLLAVTALWFGGLASYVAIQARTRRTLASRAPSILLTLRAFLPAAVIGAIQGVLVAGVVQIAARYDVGTWFAIAGIAALAGVAFAAVHQALVAVLGGAGRWIAALVGVLFFATGVISTTPAFLGSVAAALPTAPAQRALLSVITDTAGTGAAIVGMLVWLVLSLVVTTLAVARTRSTSARAVAAPA